MSNQQEYPPVFQTEKIQVMDGLNQPPTEVLKKEYGYSYVPPEGSKISHQRVVQGEDFMGNSVKYTVSKWETPDEHSGIVMIDGDDGRRGMVPTGERLTVFLQKHKLSADLQPIEGLPSEQ